MSLSGIVNLLMNTGDLMTFLLLNGHGISLRIDSAKLYIKDGWFSTKEKPKQYIFRPKQIDINSIVIYGNDGYISIEAIRWLIKHGVQVVILNWDGKLLTTMLPAESVQVKTKFAQYQAFANHKKRVELAQKFIEAKFIRTQEILEYLNQRYPDIDAELPAQAGVLNTAQNSRDIMGIEGSIAAFYWGELQRIIPDNFEFTNRAIGKTNRPIGASDWVNCMLNYGYALLESECLRAINSVGLDAHIGFLHEPQAGKNSLAYDFQEPFRFLIDLAIIDLIENRIMDNKDFIRTVSYTLRLRPIGARKVISAVNKQFSRITEYQNKEIAYSYLILLKTRELAHYLTGLKPTISFLENSTKIKISRPDSDEMRHKILSISYTEWEKMGFSKGSLYYMKKNANGDKPFTLQKHIKERLKNWSIINNTI